jgi:uncharacterized protein (DUF2267 family)
MSTSGIPVFDKTLQTTNIWLDDIMRDLGPDRQLAWHVLGVVLRAMRDRLPADLAANLSSQLPLLVRGAYYDQYAPSKPPRSSRSRDEFLAEIKQGLAMTRPVNAEDAARSVFRTVTHYTDPGQMAKVRLALAEQVRTLWPDLERQAVG